MSKDSSIHIRLEYEEAVMAKKGVLSSEVRLLKIAKAVREYGAYRVRETELKKNLAKKMREMKTNIGKLQRDLPKPRMPEILRKETEEKEVSKSSKISYDKSLEEQIIEIQKRLNELKSEAI